MVVKTAQAIGDLNDMGILSITASNATESGFHLYKTSSTCASAVGVNGGQPPACAQGKFTKFRCSPCSRCPSRRFLFHSLGEY